MSDQSAFGLILALAFAGAAFAETLGKRRQERDEAEFHATGQRLLTDAACSVPGPGTEAP